MNRTYKGWAGKDEPMVHSSVSVLEDRVAVMSMQPATMLHSSGTFQRDESVPSRMSALSEFTPTSHLIAQTSSGPIELQQVQV